MRVQEREHAQTRTNVPGQNCLHLLAYIRMPKSDLATSYGRPTIFHTPPRHPGVKNVVGRRHRSEQNHSPQRIGLIHH